MTEHISCDCKCTLNITTCNSDQNWNNRTCQCECKNYCKCKENYSTCICENSKYSKIIVDTSVTDCDKIVIVIDIMSTKKTNTIATNVTSIASINWHSNIVRDCYILIDKIWNESILIYKISYKTLIDPKPLRIRFDKIDGFVRIYDGTRY